MSEKLDRIFRNISSLMYLWTRNEVQTKFWKSSGSGARIWTSLRTGCHRRSQEFVWGALFHQKSWRPFLVVVALKRLPNLTRPAKNVLKLTLTLAGGALRVLGDALTHFPCKLRLKHFFHRPGGCKCTHCTPWLRLSCWLVIKVEYNEDRCRCRVFF